MVLRPEFCHHREIAPRRRAPVFWTSEICDQLVRPHDVELDVSDRFAALHNLFRSLVQLRRFAPRALVKLEMVRPHHR